jgi:LAO/AO transport system kinase
MNDLFSATGGSRLATARLLTEVENDTEAGRQALNDLFCNSGQAHFIGITGAPGTGKSSLVSCLARHFRQKRELTVGVIAVDPSSPFTGGAILGDRVRMRELAGDPGVFIRSMASRGELGGLARATNGIAQVLDAAGFDLVMIETVGAGQNEVDIAHLAHTTIVVDSPGMGDDIQAIKAGILEIADILVINKADHPGVENTERALRANLDLGYSAPIAHGLGHLVSSKMEDRENGSWVPPILRTIATQDEGIEAVVEAIFTHKEYLMSSGNLAIREQERLRTEVEHRIQSELLTRWSRQVSTDEYDQILQAVYQRTLSPGRAVEKLVSE